MNIENDQHILRTIMSSFYFSKIDNPKIIFSYYSDNDKESFDKAFLDCITFNEELSNYVKNIKINYINSQEILKEYFNK